ncbi:MAG: succinate dehydrogenase (quinone) flavoprotein subunit, partial [Bacteroidales bacterium]|nr:succinate dehydrogenase (quinone) flavoprotein subunit [Bacteroidales bacterium]
AYGALNRQIKEGKVQLFQRRDVLNIVIINGKARGIIARNLVTGEIERYSAHAVVLATGGYGNVYYLSTNAMGSNATVIWQAYKKGAFFGNPCFTQIHPTCIPVHGDYQSKLTLMSESLRNDGRIWVPKDIEDARKLQRGEIKAKDIPEEKRDYYLERRYPAFGNLVPRDIASRAAKERCDAGYGVNNTGLAVYLDFADAINRLGKEEIERRYGNLFQMYEKITAENPYETPMMIYPAVHYTMGGLWVDYHLMSNIPGLFVIGEANFSDHGANRLGASALMQGLADGYFILPYTIGHYLADMVKEPRIDTQTYEFNEASQEVTQQIEKLMSVNGKETVDYFHKKLGKVMWDKVGMSRTEQSLTEAIQAIKEIKSEFWKNVKVPGKANEYNAELEKAWRVADFIELGELMAMDALHRSESCGGHFREESQTEDGEAKRNDNEFAYVAAWQFQGNDKEPLLHKEELIFKEVQLVQRNYK